MNSLLATRYSLALRTADGVVPFMSVTNDLFQTELATNPD